MYLLAKFLIFSNIISGWVLHRIVGEDGDDELCCVYGMVDRRMLFSRISSQDPCQRSSPSQISDKLPAGIESALIISLGFVE